jgi:hypothetical protein
MADPSRAEVWLADLGTGLGYEQQGKRAILILRAFGKKWVTPPKTPQNQGV